MNPFIKICIPAIQTPSAGQTVEALRAEVVKEQALGRLLPQRYKTKLTADKSANLTNSNQKDSPQG